MRTVPGMLVVCLLLAGGCQQGPPPDPPVPPMPEDLAHWTVPTLIQPETQQTSALERKPRPATAAETVYDYVPGGVYKVTVALDAPQDLILEAGEKVQALIGSDPKPIRREQGEPAAESGTATLQMKERWEYKEALEGVGETAHAHILLRALEAGATLGLTVTTNARTYYLTCQSVAKSPIRAVRWNYPGEQRGLAAQKAQAPSMLPLPDEVRLFHVGYLVEGSTPRPAFAPRFIVDDGAKMYLVYSEITLFKTVPLVRALTPQGPAVVNAHQYLNVVILDVLYPKLELRLGPDTKDSHAEVVTITQGNVRTIACPNDPACPVWPVAAATRAGRTP